jgi:hypothetical protein
MVAMQVFLTILFLVVITGIVLSLVLRGPVKRAIQAGLEHDRRLAEEARQRELEAAKAARLREEALREIAEMSLEVQLRKQREDQ